jgi:hypothetical protein
MGLLLEGLYTEFNTRTQLFLIEIEGIMDMHASALIEMQGARQILSIHPKTYPALAASIEFVEGMS